MVGKLSSWLWPAIESTGPNGEFSVARRNAEDALKQVNIFPVFHLFLSNLKFYPFRIPRISGTSMGISFVSASGALSSVTTHRLQ